MYAINTVKQRGQILIMTAVCLPVLILFVGLSIDGGLVFLTKSRLSKAVDAGTLNYMRNIGSGFAAAEAYARQVAVANYTLGDPGVPEPVCEFVRNPDPAVGITVDGSCSVDLVPFFIDLMPGMDTLVVAATSQATRPVLDMVLVMDASGSMDEAPNNADEIIPDIVRNFINHFDESIDQMGLVSFSADDRAATFYNLDVALGFNTSNAINTAMDNLAYNGGTSMELGMRLAKQELDLSRRSGNGVMKVIVLFSDGLPNVFPVNYIDVYGRFDTGRFPDCPTDTEIIIDGNPNINFFEIDPPHTDITGDCPRQFSDRNLARPRMVDYADTLRGEEIFIYTVGLRDNRWWINTSGHESFLQRVAGDHPTSSESPYNGKAVYTEDRDELNAMFAQIAGQIVLRLSE